MVYADLHTNSYTSNPPLHTHTHTQTESRVLIDWPDWIIRNVE